MGIVDDLVYLFDGERWANRRLRQGADPQRLEYVLKLRNEMIRGLRHDMKVGAGVVTLAAVSGLAGYCLGFSSGQVNERYNGEYSPVFTFRSSEGLGVEGIRRSLPGDFFSGFYAGPNGERISAHCKYEAKGVVLTGIYVDGEPVWDRFDGRRGNKPDAFMSELERTAAAVCQETYRESESRMGNGTNQNLPTAPTPLPVPIDLPSQRTFPTQIL